MSSDLETASPRKLRELLGLKVTSEIKRLIDSTARASGRTQSQEAERRIELSYAYERALGEFESWKEALRKQQREIARGNAETALRQMNWKKRRDPTTNEISWVPPEQHRLPPSGFVPETEREAVASQTEEAPKAALDPRVAAALSVIMDALATPKDAS